MCALVFWSGTITHQSVDLSDFICPSIQGIDLSLSNPISLILRACRLLANGNHTKRHVSERRNQTHGVSWSKPRSSTDTAALSNMHHSSSQQVHQGGRQVHQLHSKAVQSSKLATLWCYALVLQRFGAVWIKLTVQSLQNNTTKPRVSKLSLDIHRTEEP